jgi:hypothetical protein
MAMKKFIEENDRWLDFGLAIEGVCGCNNKAGNSCMHSCHNSAVSVSVFICCSVNGVRALHLQLHSGHDQVELAQWLRRPK